MTPAERKDVAFRSASRPQTEDADLALESLDVLVATRAAEPARAADHHA